MALVVCSTIWLVSDVVVFLTNRESKDGWSNAPLPAMLALCLCPVLCVSIAYLLVESRREQKFTVLDWCGFFEALVAAVFGMFFLGGVLLQISD